MRFLANQFVRNKERLIITYAEAIAQGTPDEDLEPIALRCSVCGEERLGKDDLGCRCDRDAWAYRHGGLR